MNRDELTALRNAIDVVLVWPDAVRDQVAAWLAPEAIREAGNGVDRDPPTASPADNGSGRIPESHPHRPAPHVGKTRHGRSSTAAKTDERLLEALRDAPGLSAVKLAAAVRINRSTVGERLRELAGRELVETDDDGRWRFVEEKAARVEPGPQSPSL